MTAAGYTLGRLLGRGGMSEVYAASHPTLGEVALKLLLRELTDEKVTASFLGEAAQTRRIRHGNVVRILDAGRDDSGRCYVAMERIDGEDLATRLKAGPLSEDEARDLFAAIADGMHAVHAAGIVHRDLKPANVMLRGSSPLIVDFGIAKSLGAQSALATSRRIGTPAYMAPEQLTGGLIAPCVDVWALGVMMFEAVTGTLPFDDFAEGRAPQLFETAPRALSRAAISPALDLLIARCLERDPGKRARSMDAIARELRGDVDLETERVTQDAGALLPTPAAMSPAAMPPAAMPPASTSPASMSSAAMSPAAMSPAAMSPAAMPPAAMSPASMSPAATVGSPGMVAPRRRWPWLVGGASVVALLAGAFALRGGGAADASAPSGTTNRSDPSSRTTEPDGEAPAVPAATGASDRRTIKGSDSISGTGASDRRTTKESDSISGTGASERRATKGSELVSAKRRSLTVEVRSQPSGAQILVAGKQVGVTPKRIELAGPASLVVKHAGYRSANVKAEKPGALDVRLVPLATRPRESLD